MRIKFDRIGCYWEHPGMSLCVHGVSEWFHIPHNKRRIWLRIEEEVFPESYRILIVEVLHEYAWTRRNIVQVYDSIGRYTDPFTPSQEAFLRSKFGFGTFFLGVEHA